MLEFDWKSVVMEYLQKYEVEARNFELVEFCIEGLVEPVDGHKWARSWRKTPTRLRNVLDEKSKEYWEVFRYVGVIPANEIQVWNDMADLSVSKKLRVFGRDLDLAKVYVKGRFFWDFLVLCMLKGNKSLRDVVIGSLDGVKVEVVYPKWCISYLQRGGKVKGQLDVQVIVDGK
jgi:hypothetical protein